MVDAYTLNKEQERKHDELIRAFNDVLSTASGKRVLYWMLEQCAIYRDAYSGDPHATSYTLGLQAGGRRIIGMMDGINPRLYPQLLLDIADMHEIDDAVLEENDDDLD